jgi:hypothetical protein
MRYFLICQTQILKFPGSEVDMEGMAASRGGTFQRMMQVGNKKEMQSITPSNELDEFIMEVSSVYDNILLMVPADNAPHCSMEKIREGFPHNIFEMWLWFTDPNEERPKELAFGSMHIIGLLLAMTSDTCDPLLSPTALAADECSFFLSASVPYNQMTLQQLQDHLEACQWCWQDCTENHSVATLRAHLQACFARFGWMCISARPDSVFGGSMFREESGHSGLFFVSAAAIRTHLVIFFVLFRILHLIDAAAEGDRAEHVSKTCVRQHHVEASTDTFNILSMHYDLPPAALLCYKDQFTEFYNSISQVVYKYFPDYCRKTQLSVTEINEKWHIIPALSCATQIYPEIEIIYEDTVLYYIPAKGVTQAGRSAKTTWNWMLIGGNVFLLGSNGTCMHVNTCTHGIRQCLAVYEARTS